MSNTFITPTMVARDAAIVLHDRLVTGNLVSRDKEGMFTANKIGDTVKVTVPGVFVAEDFTGATNAQDATETEVDVTLEKWKDVRVDLTSKQKSLELSDFTRLITVPAMDAIFDAIDTYFIDVMFAGFARNVAGTEGARPSTMAHIVAGDKVMRDNKAQSRGRVGLIDTTVNASFLQLAQFTSGDYGQDAPPALREAMLARRLGFDWYVDANSAVHDRGDIAGTVLTDGTPVLAATTLHVDGFTAATGTVYKGTRFTVAGDSQVYTLTANATLASNECDFAIYPAVSADLVAAGDGAAVTFKAASYKNLLYLPGAVAGAIVAPTAMAVGSAVQSYMGVSVRVSMSSSTVSLSDSVVFDVFAGANVVQPNGGCVLCG